MVQVNANAVQHCHEAMLRSLETTLNLSRERARMGGVPLDAAAAAELLRKLQATMHFAALNRDGFRKILKKFDKRTGCCVSPAALADLQRRGFFADSSVFGNGRCAALLIALNDALRAARP